MVMKAWWWAGFGPIRIGSGLGWVWVRVFVFRVFSSYGSLKGVFNLSLWVVACPSRQAGRGGSLAGRAAARSCTSPTILDPRRPQETHDSHPYPELHDDDDDLG